LPRRDNPDLSIIADRVLPQTWSLFQSLRTKMRQLRGVEMRVQYETNSNEPVPFFTYQGRQLFHLHVRGNEINATFHTDLKSRLRIVENQGIDWRLRDQVKKRTWAGFSLRSSKDLGPFMELVRAKYKLIDEEITGKRSEERPIAV
jgi:hypothetical protein